MGSDGKCNGTVNQLASRSGHDNQLNLHRE